MHRSPDRFRPSLRLTLSGSENTAWEQASDRGYHNRVHNGCVLFFLSGRWSVFYVRTCPQQVRTAPLQGVLPALQAKLSLRCGKSRQRQMHLFLNFMHYVQTVWDKTLLSHCRVIYLSRNMLQQVQPVFEVRVLSLPGPTGTRPQDGYLFKDFFIWKYRLQQVQPAGLGGILLPSAAKWSAVFIKTGKDSNLSRVFAYKMIRWHGMIL